MAGFRDELSLLCRVRSRSCALPLSNVIETMRPLPVELVSGAPRFLLGVSVIRGEPIPVIGARRLLGDPDGDPGRFVTLRTGDRTVALAVDEVLAVRSVQELRVSKLPPLLRDVDSRLISAIGVLDAELLVVLSAARLYSGEAYSEAFGSDAPS